MAAWSDQPANAALLEELGVGASFAAFALEGAAADGRTAGLAEALASAMRALISDGGRAARSAALAAAIRAEVETRPQGAAGAAMLVEEAFRAYDGPTAEDDVWDAGGRAGACPERVAGDVHDAEDDDDDFDDVS